MARTSKRQHPHRQARALVLIALYQMDVGGHTVDEALNNVREEAVEASVMVFVEEFTRGVCAQREGLDQQIRERSHNWSWDRMARVDRNVLRMGAFELLHRPATPRAVAINEAVELVKVYGDEKSATFVNGLLDSIGREDTP